MADDNETNAAAAPAEEEEAAAPITAPSASEDVVPEAEVKEEDAPVTDDTKKDDTTTNKENGDGDETKTENTKSADGTTTIKAIVDVTTTTMSTTNEEEPPVKEEDETKTEEVVKEEESKTEEGEDTKPEEVTPTTGTSAVEEATTATTKEEEEEPKKDEETPETEIKEETTKEETVEPTDDDDDKKKDETTTEAMDVEKEEETKEEGGEKPPPQDAPMEDADKPAETSPAGRAGKRIRKSVEAYNPTSYASETISGPSRASIEGLEQLQVPEGRGTVLDEMEIVKESIEGHAERDAEILAVAHRVIFGGRGKFIVTKQPKKKEVMTQSILQFSGYLKPITSEFDETKRLKAEDMEKKKYEDRLMKWQKDTLIDLCHFFALDVSAQKGKPQSKNDVVEKLLQFLSAPSEELVNSKVVFRRKHQLKMDSIGGKRASRGSTGSSKKTPGKKGKKKMKTSKGSVKPNKNSPYAEWDTDEDEEEEESEEEESEAEAEGEDESEEEEEASDDDDAPPPPKKRGRKSKATPTKGSSPKKLNGKMPSETAIKEWVEHYVGCFNLNKVTTNHALATATDKFHCDMTPKKPMIKELLKNAILYQM